MKKTLTFLSLMMILFTAANAQYYIIPHINAGTNPKGLNNDIEQPTTTGWAVIATTAATPVWSSIATIPFSFDFNGTSYSSAIVSTSGVLTFTTTAINVPASTSQTLPSASIPDNSVCVWGLSGAGTNDQIRTKTFGTTPNRQFWFQFNSYSSIGSTGFTYWAIVLEETTNNIYVVDQRTYNCPLALSIGLQFSSSSAVSVAGSPTLGSNATLNGYDTPVDNSFFQFIPGVQPVSEAEFSSIMAPVYQSFPNSVNITGTISNYGSSPITTITFKYTDGTNVATDVKTGLNIASGATYNFTHSTPYSIPAVGTYNITSWIELAGDPNQTNDTLTTTITGVPFLPVHTVVIEEGTGTWCGWCPRGAVFMDSVNAVHPAETVLIAVHNADPMTVTAYDAGVSGQIPGYPSVLINRNIVDDPSNIFTQYAARINDFGFADLTVNPVYNAVTHVISIGVDAHFAADLTGDYRLAAVITEDHVSGTTTDYDQHNYYSFQTNNQALQGAGHNWQNETDPVPAANMEYNHVARALLGGYSGMSGSLPGTIPSGSIQTYNFSYTVPSTVNINNVHVNAMLIDATNNRILNGNKGAVILGINNHDELIGNFGIAPNPAVESSTISYSLKKENNVSLEVTNILGKIVKTENFGVKTPGTYNINLNCNNLADGLYFVTLTVGNNRYSDRVAVSR